MNGIHHIIINVKDLAKSREFYAWLMPKLGYPAFLEHETSGLGWLGPGGSFRIKQADPELPADFNKDRVGLCEVAFRAESRQQVDELARALVARRVRILDPPREYSYVQGYYAVFFSDPDGIKLELVHLPF